MRARNNDGAGLYARTIPLRFENGSLTTVRRKRLIAVPIVKWEGHEVLYIVSFCLPRFQNLPFDDKLMTVFHELYHIGPNFDGDIRRFDGANYIHTSSQKKYDALMRRLAAEYLTKTQQPELHQFLKLSYSQLVAAYGGVRMTIYRAPKPQLVRENVPAPMRLQAPERPEEGSR